MDFLGTDLVNAGNVSAFTAGGSTPVTMSSVTIDFGANGIFSGTFQITLSGANTTNKVMMMPVGSSDELEMDSFICAANVVSQNTIIAYIVASPGPVSNTRTFNILLG